MDHMNGVVGALKADGLNGTIERGEGGGEAGDLADGEEEVHSICGDVCDGVLGGIDRDGVAQGTPLIR